MVRFMTKQTAAIAFRLSTTPTDPGVSVIRSAGQGFDILKVLHQELTTRNPKHVVRLQGLIAILMLLICHQHRGTRLGYRHHHA